MWLLLPVYWNTVSLVNYEASQVMVELLVSLLLTCVSFTSVQREGLFFQGFTSQALRQGPRLWSRWWKSGRDQSCPTVAPSVRTGPDRTRGGERSVGERKGERAAAHKGIWHFRHIHQDNSMAALESNMIIFIFQPLALPLWAKVKWAFISCWMQTSVSGTNTVKTGPWGRRPAWVQWLLALCTCDLCCACSITTK